MKSISTEQLNENQWRLIKMLKALGNPTRFQIVVYLTSCDTCITNDLVKNSPLAQSTVSQHLKVLREAGLIKGEVEGPATCYCLDPEAFAWLKTNLLDWIPGNAIHCPSDSMTGSEDRPFHTKNK